MFSTPLICSSIGATTVVATTSALAPGYWPATLMIGGAISGYCATGRRMNDTPPRMTNTIDSTEAKIGRSMKKCEIRMARCFSSSPAGRRRRRGALLLRRDLWPGRARIRPLTTTRSSGLEPVLDDAQVADELAERDVFAARGVLGIDHQHELAHLLGADRGVRHQQRLVGRRARHAHAPEHAGREHAVRIGEHRAAADRAGRAVDHVVDEVHRARDA